MRLHVVEQSFHNPHIFFAHRQFLNASALIERQVEEVHMVGGNPVESASRAGFAPADQALDGEHVTRVEIAVFLAFEKGFYFLVFVAYHLIGIVSEELVEPVDEVHESRHLFVAHGNVSARLVGDMHIMSLLHQPADRTAHRNHVVVGMRREHQYALGVGGCSLRTARVISVWLSSRPSRNRVLQVVENLDIGIVGRTVECQQFRKSVGIIILVGELQERFAGGFTKPHQRRAHQFVRPRTGSDEPRMHNAREA